MSRPEGKLFLKQLQLTKYTNIVNEIVINVREYD